MIRLSINRLVGFSAALFLAAAVAHAAGPTAKQYIGPVGGPYSEVYQDAGKLTVKNPNEAPFEVEQGGQIADIDDLPGDTVDDDLIDDVLLPPSITRDAEHDTWAEQPGLQAGYIIQGDTSNQPSTVNSLQVQALFPSGSLPNLCYFSSGTGEIAIGPDGVYGCTGLDVWAGPGGTVTTAADRHFFESGAAFLNGELGSMTWANSGVSENTTIFSQGACSADFDYGDYLSIADTSLPANAPGKSSSFSIVLDVYLDSYPTNATGYKLVTKWNHDLDTRSFHFGIAYSTNNWKFAQGHTSGTAYDEAVSGQTPALNKWYRVGLAYDNTANSLLLVVYDISAQTYTDFDAGTAGQQDYTHTFSNAISLTTAPLMLGNYEPGTSGLDGKIDNLHMWGAALTREEFDAVFTRTE